MALTRTLALGLVFLSSSLAADGSSTCAGQNTISDFEYSQHGGAYDSPYNLPGGEAEGLFWGLSSVFAPGYNYAITPSSYPVSLYFKGNSNVQDNYISTFEQSFYKYTPIDHFTLNSFDFGCTRVQPYKNQNGSTITTEVPVSCSLGITYISGYGDEVVSNYTAKYTPKVEKKDGYYDMPWAYPTHVSLTPPSATYHTIEFSVLGKLAGDGNVTVYLDSFNHTNYYCPGYVAPG